MFRERPTGADEPVVCSLFGCGPAALGLVSRLGWMIIYRTADDRPGHLNHSTVFYSQIGDIRCPTAAQCPFFRGRFQVLFGGLNSPTANATTPQRPLTVASTRPSGVTRAKGLGRERGIPNPTALARSTKAYLKKPFCITLRNRGAGKAKTKAISFVMILSVMWSISARITQ